MHPDTRMNHYIHTPIPLNPNLTSHLLINIFIPNTPLHHPPLIIKRHHIPPPTCYLPLSQTPFISNHLPTPHPPPLPITQLTHTLTLILSHHTP
ncbi:diadenylate cyclase, partial [Bacillus altitudinis]|uniref:diadenylate cyclase n=1 Tax=Bacillus altitudinis TaxID=293387 RepID=UPI003B521BDF